MPATTGVIILNLAKDKSEDSWAATRRCSRSPPSRGSSTARAASKIYLTNSPQKWTGVLNPPNVDQFALDDGLVPVTHTTPTLDNTKRFPVLSYLAANYGSFLNGKIMYPSLSQTVNDSAVMAAVTAAAQENAIPLSSTIEAYLAGEGAPTRRSTTPARSRASWMPSTGRRRTTCRRTPPASSWQSTASGTGVVAPSSCRCRSTTSWRARHSSTVWMRNIPAQRTAISSLLNTTNYPAGTPVLGRSTESCRSSTRSRTAGTSSSSSTGRTTPCTAPSSSEPSQITAPTAPTAAPIVSNGAYVAFYITDGDNVSIAHYNHHNWWRNSPDKGEVPIGWSLPPILLDIYPKKMQWFSSHNYSNAYEIVANYERRHGTEHRRRRGRVHLGLPVLPRQLERAVPLGELLRHVRCGQRRRHGPRSRLRDSWVPGCAERQLGDLDLGERHP